MKRFLVFGTMLLVLSGCGKFSEANNHNANPPTGDIEITWVRLKSPANYHTIVKGCYQHNGLYLTQADNNSVVVVPNDPTC